MGQVIAFPNRRPAHARLSTALRVLCAVTYVLGFFIAGPTLVLGALAFAVTLQLVAALISLGGLALVAWLTYAAYQRI